MIKIIDEDKNKKEKPNFIKFSGKGFFKGYDAEKKVFIVSKEDFDDWD